MSGCTAGCRPCAVRSMSTRVPTPLDTTRFAAGSGPPLTLVSSMTGQSCLCGVILLFRRRSQSCGIFGVAFTAVQSARLRCSYSLCGPQLPGGALWGGAVSLATGTRAHDYSRLLLGTWLLGLCLCHGAEWTWAPLTGLWWLCTSPLHVPGLQPHTHGTLRCRACGDRPLQTSYSCAGCDLVLCPGCAARSCTGHPELFVCVDCALAGVEAHALGMPASGGAGLGTHRADWVRLIRGAEDWEARRLRVSSQRTYAGGLADFTDFCHARGVAPLPAAPEILRGYIYHCTHDRGLDVGTVSGRLSAVSDWHRRQSSALTRVGRWGLRRA